MSFAELLVVMVVALLVLKPEDLPAIWRKFSEVRKLFQNLKSEVTSQIDGIFPDTVDKIEGELDNLNFYLEKISDLGGKYDGDYTLSSVKREYHKLVKEKLHSDKVAD